MSASVLSSTAPGPSPPAPGEVSGTREAPLPVLPPEPAPPVSPIAASGLGKRYPNGVEALRNLDFRVERGEMVGLLGPSGSGKTTLIRLISGAIWPTAGALRVFGEDVSEQRARGLRARRRRVATIAQQHSLVPHVSVLQNVLLGRAGKIPLWRSLRAALVPTQVERTDAYRLLAALDIGDLLDRPVESLSGGQQQRVAVARAAAWWRPRGGRRAGGFCRPGDG